MSLAAGVLDHQVAREGEHRQRLLVRVGAQEHERVRAPCRDLAGPLVVADDDRDRWLAGDDGVQLLRRPDHLLRGGPDGGDAVVEVELHATRERAGRDEHRDDEPHDALREQLQRVAPDAVEGALGGGRRDGRRGARGRRRRGCDAERRLRARMLGQDGEVGRVGAVAVAVAGAVAVHRAPGAFLQSRPHGGMSPRGDRMRIAKLTAVQTGSTRAGGLLPTGRRSGGS